MNHPIQEPFLLNLIYRKPYHIQDEGGRAIGESRAPEACFQENPIEWKTCPYSGSRSAHSKKMNNSAYLRMASNWKAAEEEAKALRRWYQREYGEGEIGLTDLWKLVFVTSNYPFFVYHRAQNPMERIPDVTAELFKINIGLRPVLDDLFFFRTKHDLDLEPITAEEILNWAEEHDSFIGSTGVCAGPPKLIVQAFNWIIHRENPSTGLQGHYAAAGEDFLNFSRCVMSTYFAQKLFGIRQHLLLWKLERELEQADPKALSAPGGINKLLEGIFAKKRSQRRKAFAFFEEELPFQYLINPVHKDIDKAVAVKLLKALRKVLANQIGWDPEIEACFNTSYGEKSPLISNHSMSFQNQYGKERGKKLDGILDEMKWLEDAHFHTLGLIDRKAVALLGYEAETSSEQVAAWWGDIRLPNLAQAIS